jgi:hypothetical protein
VRLSDFTSFEGVKAAFIKLIVTLFALILIGDLVCEVANRLTFLDVLALFAFFLLVSPVAYFIRERRCPPRPERPRGGAERAPVLPPREDDEE